MGRFIVKASPTDDLYCEWSSSADAPTWIGTRSELVEWLSAHETCCEAACGTHAVQARVLRSDITGTSAIDIGEGAWGDSGFVYLQQGWLPRSRLAALLRRLLTSSEPDPDVSDLLDPFEDG